MKNNVSDQADCLQSDGKMMDVDDSFDDYAYNETLRDAPRWWIQDSQSPVSMSQLQSQHWCHWSL